MNIHHRLFLLFAVFTAALGATAQNATQRHRVSAPAHMGAPIHATAPAKRAPHDVTLLSENFDKFAAGSEAAPDATDLCLEKNDWCIDPSLLQTPGWNGGGIYQAGGSAYIYTYFDDYSQNFYLGYLESPRFDTSASRGEFIVCFRARSVQEQDWLGVCGVPQNHNEAKQKWAVIGKEWGYYEVTLGCGDENTCVQFEPMSDACFIDDVRVIQVVDDGEGEERPALATPEPLPVDDFTDEGYTARWKAVNGADDYAVYNYLYRTATADGEEFDYINTDFSAITAGSIEAPVNPSDLGEADSDFYRYLDDITDRADWMAYMPMWAGGCLALDNSYAAVLPAGLSSATLRPVAAGDKLYMGIDVMSPSLTTMTLYMYGEKGLLGDCEIPLTPQWQHHDITFVKCDASISFELVVEDEESGVVYVDNLCVWQNLAAGQTAHVATSYDETADTSLYIHTPNTPAGCRNAFSVSAYKYEIDEEGDITDYVMSRWSDPCYADGQSAEGIAPLRLNRTALPYSIGGRRATTNDRLVISDGKVRMR